jgi:uncharacterized RDD family membrane protein YckC
VSSWDDTAPSAWDDAPAAVEPHDAGFWIRVLATVLDGQPVTYGTAIIRYLMLIVSIIVRLLGVIWVAFDSRKQGWMDKVAGTYVIRD